MGICVGQCAVRHCHPRPTARDALQLFRSADLVVGLHRGRSGSSPKDSPKAARFISFFQGMDPGRQMWCLFLRSFDALKTSEDMVKTW